MIISCPSCGARYKFDESKLGGAPNKRIRCPKCSGRIEIVNSNSGKIIQSGKKGSVEMDGTLPSPSRSSTAGKDPETGTQKLRSKTGSGALDSYLQLPDMKRLSLAVIQGLNSGEIFQITKPKMVIGRIDSDITVKDLEASRQHARLEVMGPRIILRDLESTNGTFVEEEKIDTAELENHSEFRIGTTVFMLIITDVD